MPTRETIELNILGQVCPSCLMVTLNAINTYQEGLKTGKAEILVRTDHRDATRTIPDSARAMGYEVDVRKIASYYEIRVRCAK